MIARRLFLIAAASLALPACGSNLLGPPDAGPIYLVRPDFPQSQPAANKVPWALTVLRPDLPDALDTDRIALTQPDGTMDYYAKATYPAPLAGLVQDAVLDGFEASGRIDAVAKEQDALHADYDLSLDVREFQAQYAQPDGVPSVRVTINAKLATAHGRRILASFTTRQTGTATANSTAAATQALKQALGAAVAAIVDWTFRVAPDIPPGQSAETAAPSPGKQGEELLHESTRRSNGEKVPTPPR